MKHTLNQCTKQVMTAIKQPEIRHNMHYECGLYKTPSDRSPLACIRMSNDCTVPLCKVIALLGIAIALIVTVKAMSNAILRVVCRCKRPSMLCAGDRS